MKMVELAATYEMREDHWPLKRVKVRGEHTVEVLVDRLGLPESVLSSSRDLIIAYKSKSGRESSPSIAAASVVIVSRELGIPLSISEVSMALKGRISPGKIASSIGEIKTVLGIKSPVPWEVYVDYVLWKLSRSEEFSDALSGNKVPRHILIERMRIKTRKLIKAKLDLIKGLVGKNPVIISGALVYIAAQSLGIRSITQRLVANSIGVSRASLVRIVKSLR